MRAITAAFAIVLTVLLSVIAIELYRIDQSLAWLSAPVKGIASAVASSSSSATTETRQQRIDRKAREINDVSEETRDVLMRAIELQSQGPSARPPLPRR